MKYIDPRSGAVASVTKRCRGCEHEKPISEFPWNTEREAPMSRCYDCKNRYHRERYAAKRRCAWTTQRAPYKPEDVAALRACIEAGMTLAETAEKLGRTTHAVRHARANHYLPKFHRQPPPVIRPQWTDDKLARLAQLKVAGHSFNQMGRVFRVTRNAISGAMRTHRQRIQELIADEAGRSVGAR